MKKSILIKIVVFSTLLCLSSDLHAGLSGKSSSISGYSYLGSETITFVWNKGNIGPEVEIIGYHFQVGTTLGDYGNYDDYYTVGKDNLSYDVTNCQEGLTYYARVRARGDPFGSNFSDWSDDSSGVAISLTELEIRDRISEFDLDFNSSSTTIKAYWNTVLDANSYYYAIGSSTQGATDIVDWTEVYSTSISSENLKLSYGTTYYVAIKANYSDGTESLLRYSTTFINNEYSGAGEEQNFPWGDGPDNSSYDYQLPFIFYFYGKPYTNAWIGTNGYLTFENSCKEHLNSGTSLKNEIMIAPLWDDLFFEASDDIYISSNTDSVTIRWLAHLPSTSTLVNFETVLYKNRDIKFNYGSGNTGISATVGISNGRNENSNDFLIVYGDTDTLTDVKTVWIKPQDYCSDGVRIDTTPPVGMPPFAPEDEGVFSTDELTFTWSIAGSTAADAESGIAGYKLEVSESSTSWTTISQTIVKETTGTLSGFISGKTYFARVKAMSGAGVFTIPSGISDGIVVDTTPPTGLPVIVSPGDYNDSTTVDFSWSTGTVSDTESGINGYKLEVYTDLGYSVLDSSAYIVNATTKQLSGFSDTQKYYFKITAKNNAGLYDLSPATGSVTIDTTEPPEPANIWPIPTGIDGTIVYSSSTVLWFGWNASTDTESGITGYRLRIMPKIEDPFTFYTGAVTSTCTPAGLDGEEYSAKVMSVNGAGEQSEFWSSDSKSIIVDISEPTGSPNYLVDQGTWCSKSTLDFEWEKGTSADNISGIVGYHLILSATTGFETIISSANFYGIDTDSGTITVSLTESVTYYARICAINGAGSYSVYSSTTNGIQVDESPPDGKPDIPYPDSYRPYFIGKSTITFSWSTGTVIDVQSGISGYHVRVSTFPEFDVMLTSGVVYVSSYTVTGCEHGQTYYASVTAVNGADLYGLNYSTFTDGVLVDLTVPDGTPGEKDPQYYGSSIKKVDGDYYIGKSTIPFSWYSAGATDGQSGVIGYYLEVSTDVNYWGPGIEFSGDVGTVTSKDIHISTTSNGNTFYSRVAALNGAGLYGLFSSTNSNFGITMDITPPFAPSNVYDGLGSDLPETPDDSQLDISWSVVVEESGIDGYDFSIGTAPGSINVYGWTGSYHDFISTSVAFTPNAFNLPGDLNWGATYYVNVRAKNYLEVVSTYVVSSNGIRLVDNTKPGGKPIKPTSDEWSKFRTVTFTWQVGAAVDDQSHIEGFWLQVSTAQGGSEKFSGYAGDGALTYSIINCEHGKTYYARVKARNFMGLYAEDADYSDDSDGITVDLVVPAKPENVSMIKDRLADGGYTLTVTGSAEAGAQIKSDSVVITDQDGNVINRYIPSGQVSALATGTTIHTNTLVIDGSGNISGTIIVSNIPDKYPLVGTVNITIYVYDEAGNKSAGSSAFSITYEVDEPEFSCWNNVYKLGESNLNPSVKYGLTDEGNVTIKIYNLLGDFVKTLVDDESRDAGIYSQEWDIESDMVASGVYLVHIEAPGLSATKKIVVVK